jgi:hypothetical protein
MQLEEKKEKQSKAPKTFAETAKGKEIARINPNKVKQPGMRRSSVW